MSTGLPLPTLLSQVLVAFTIEFDNEFERLMPHRTTSGGAGGACGALWLVSMAMWSNVMRLVDEDGLTVEELESRAGTPKLALAGMQRWRYIVVERESTGSGSKTRRPEWRVRATAKGLRAREVWRPLFGTIEKRWRDRFGEGEFDQLREALWEIVDHLDCELPDYLPVLGYGLFSEVRIKPGVRNGGRGERPNLPTLLAKVLLAFTVDFESGSKLSLAVCANALRLLGGDGARVRDLPRLSGVSKEAIAISTGWLERHGYLTIERHPPAGRTKVCRPTPKGREALDAYRRRLIDLEGNWRARFGKDAIGKLREPLERLAGKPTAPPHPEGWRAALPEPETMPHHPMVLHRGGYPDGS